MQKMFTDSFSNLPKIIAVDFDGTLCEDQWPNIGKPNNIIIEALKRCRKDGVKLILWTCRTNEGKGQDYLDDAVKWCHEKGLYFDAINMNIPEVMRLTGGDTRKVYANLYLDDKSLSIEDFYKLYV